MSVLQSSSARGLARRQALLQARAREMRFAPTPSEVLLWQRVRGRRLGVAFKRQVVVAGFIADFVAPSRSLVSRLTETAIMRGGALLMLRASASSCGLGTLWSGCQRRWCIRAWMRPSLGCGRPFEGPPAGWLGSWRFAGCLALCVGWWDCQRYWNVPFGNPAAPRPWQPGQERRGFSRSGASERRLKIASLRPLFEEKLLPFFEALRRVFLLFSPPAR